MNNINLDTLVARKKNIIASDMNGETVMMSIETGKYYNLGNIGGAIWVLVEGSIKVEDIVIRLMEEYDVTRKQCEDEVLSFLNQLCEQALIEVI